VGYLARGTVFVADHVDEASGIVIAERICGRSKIMDKLIFGRSW
jgi:hypothetical protein